MSVLKAPGDPGNIKEWLATREPGESQEERSTAPTSSKPSNRLREIVLHISWYGFRTQARLARDSGVSPSAISRVMRGICQPTISVALKLTAALSRRMGHSLDLREVFSADGTYPTPSVCDLMGCRRCALEDKAEGGEW